MASVLQFSIMKVLCSTVVFAGSAVIMVDVGGSFRQRIKIDSDYLHEYWEKGDGSL